MILGPDHWPPGFPPSPIIGGVGENNQIPRKGSQGDMAGSHLTGGGHGWMEVDRWTEVGGG